MSRTLDEATRRAVFLTLVTSQDQGSAVQASRDQVAGAFGISASLVQLIETEGLRKNWPPLNDTAPPRTSPTENGETSCLLIDETSEGLPSA